MIHVLVAQKDTLWRGALTTVLRWESDLRVVAELACADEVLPVARRQRPDVTVLDVPLPGRTDIDELCAQLCGALPDARVLLVVDQYLFAETGLAVARLVPQVGLTTKDVAPPELVEEIRRLARGEPVLDVRLAVAALTAEESPLTSRERDVLRHASRGASVPEIAAQLCLTVGTVRNYMARAVTKTGARTRIEALRIARDSGWI